MASSKTELQQLLVAAQRYAQQEDDGNEFFWGVIVHTIQELIKHAKH